MKVLLILPNAGVHSQGNALIHRILQRSIPLLSWCAGTAVGMRLTLSKGYLYLRSVNGETGEENEQPMKVSPGDFDIAIIDQSRVPVDDPSSRPFDDSSHQTLDFEGHDRPSRIVRALTAMGVVCVGTSREGACLAEMTEAGAVLGCSLEELPRNLSGLMEEAERLVKDNQKGGGMKALTLRQPFAWSIFHAGKDVENRQWPARVRGTVAIHAAGEQPAGVYEASKKFIRSILRRQGIKGVRIPSYSRLPQGAIIGVVDIVDCVNDASQAGSDWFEGPLGFRLANPRLLPRPIPCAGKRRFFTVPPVVDQQIQKMLSGKR